MKKTKKLLKKKLHRPVLCVKSRCIVLAFFMFVSLFTTLPVTCANKEKSEINIDNPTLYALGACLYDATDGRVLYGKNEEDKMPNASTTKIMTLILAIEYGNMNDVVNVSKYAASMPDVKMKIHEAENYYLKDLMYGMMLESYNDVSVAIAEHIAGSVEKFAEMMNDKARELGCENSFFVTPNGLDKKSKDGFNEHGTSAKDLCIIMSYCVKNPEFIKITQTKNYSFCNVLVNSDGKIINGNRNFSVNNKNKLLYSMNDLLSGKTGFTSKAGYCYVCAVKRNEKVVVISLLACGWPNNKNYKWNDTKKLLEYFDKYFKERCINEKNNDLPIVTVKNGMLEKEKGDIIVSPTIQFSKKKMLLCVKDKVNVEIECEKELVAPVKKGTIVGQVKYYVGDEIVYCENIIIDKDIRELEFKIFFDEVFDVVFGM